MHWCFHEVKNKMNVDIHTAPTLPVQLVHHKYSSWTSREDVTMRQGGLLWHIKLRMWRDTQIKMRRHKQVHYIAARTLMEATFNIHHALTVPHLDCSRKIHMKPNIHHDDLSFRFLETRDLVTIMFIMLCKSQV